MGVDNAIGFFVNDPEFVPTKQQLYTIAMIFENYGVLDKVERENIEQRIEALYPEEDEPVIVKDKECDHIEYTLMRQVGLPFFDGDIGLTYGSWHEPWPLKNELEEKGQEMSIYKEKICMQPYSGDHYTRFVLAHQYLDGRRPIDWLMEIQRRMDANGTLLGLRSTIKKLLEKEVVTEILYY